MSDDNQLNIAEQWVDAATSRDAARARSLLSDDVQVSPPFLEEPVSGADAAMRVFGAFIAATREFEYGRIWTNGSATILEFRAKVDGRLLTGLDVIEVGDDGKITRFDICARPLSAIAALGEAAKAHLNRFAGSA